MAVLGVALIGNAVVSAAYPQNDLQWNVCERGFENPRAGITSATSQYTGKLQLSGLRVRGGPGRAYPVLANAPRYLRVLELAATRAGWGSALPDGVFRGIAVHKAFESYVAQVAEVSVGSDGTVRVHRVVCAVDCGPVVNPDTVSKIASVKLGMAPESK